MEEQRPDVVRQERREVVEETGPTTVEESTTTAAEQVESAVIDPYAERRVAVYRLRQAIYLLFGVVEGLIAIRFVLRLLGANPNADFAALVYAITAPLVAPFAGLFGTPQAGGSVFEPHSLVAIVIYALVAWVLGEVVWLAFGEPRSGVAASTRRVRTRAR